MDVFPFGATLVIGRRHLVIGRPLFHHHLFSLHEAIPSTHPTAKSARYIWLQIGANANLFRKTCTIEFALRDALAEYDLERGGFFYRVLEATSFLYFASFKGAYVAICRLFYIISLPFQLWLVRVILSSSPDPQ
jgi:hypothetical protein